MFSHHEPLLARLCLCKFSGKVRCTIQRTTQVTNGLDKNVNSRKEQDRISNTGGQLGPYSGTSRKRPPLMSDFGGHLWEVSLIAI